VFRQQDAYHYSSGETIKTAPRARTGFLLSGRVYVAAPAVNGPAAVTAYELR